MQNSFRFELMEQYRVTLRVQAYSHGAQTLEVLEQLAAKFVAGVTVVLDSRFRGNDGLARE